MKILIAYDGSPAADAAVQETLKRSWPAGTEVRVVNVVDWPIALEPPFPADYPGPAVEGIHAMMIEKAKRSVEGVQRALAEKRELTVTTDLREGSPKHALLDSIETWGPDLVMTGSTGKKGLKRLLVGSVCHAL